MILADEQQHAIAVIVGLDIDPESIKKQLAEPGLSPAEKAELMAALGQCRERDAWSAQADVEAKIGPAIVAELIRLDLAIVWDRDALGQPLQDGPQLTLTPWGEYLARHYLDERIVLLDGIDGDGMPCENIVEVAYWTQANPMTERRPIQLPARRGIYSDRFLEAIVDPKPGPAEEVELMMDGEGEKPVELFGGYQVKIDRRIKKGGAKGKRKGRAA